MSHLDFRVRRLEGAAAMPSLDDTRRAALLSALLSYQGTDAGVLTRQGRALELLEGARQRREETTRGEVIDRCD